MASFTFTLDTGRTYWLPGLIRGTVTTGVTASATRSGQTVNVQRLTLQGHPGNGGNNVAFGDSSIATDASTGRVLLAGDVQEFDGTPTTTLNRYVAVSATTTKLNVELE